VAAHPVLEHRVGPTSRWLREHRVRLALAIAIVEAVLVLTDVLGWFWIVLIAAVVVTFHFFVGRRARFDWLRQLSWTAAAAQTLPVLLPIAIAVAATFVVLAVLAAAIIVLALLFFRRR
jgi:hypothetical protein